jgi:hypothetical protein
MQSNLSTLLPDSLISKARRKQSLCGGLYRN